MIIALVDALVSLTDAGHLRAPACEACSNVHAPRHTHGVIIKSAALTFSPPDDPECVAVIFRFTAFRTDDDCTDAWHDECQFSDGECFANRSRDNVAA
jgi:hypothetical protein